jgi:hypothetical protein
MKIETKGKELRIDGRDFSTLTYDENTNVWLRCVDYMRTNYHPTLAAHIARCVPCYFGQFRGDGEGFSIEI